MGEIRGLARWRTRYKAIGLDERLIDNATEKAGMFLVQVERFMVILSSVVQQVCFSFIFPLFSFLNLDGYIICMNNDNNIGKSRNIDIWMLIEICGILI